MNPLLKVSLRYGVLAGVVGSCLLIGLYYLGRHPFLIPVYLDFRIILFAIFVLFTLREIRDYFQGGVLYFWQGIIASFVFTACFAIISSVVVIAFVHLVPDFLSDYVALQIQQLKSLPEQTIESIGKDVYERNIKLLPATNAFDLGLTYFVQCFGIGFFISVILSVTLRVQPET